MEQDNSLDEFRKKWGVFLNERGHKVGYPKGVGCVLQSRNGAKKQYRWILIVTQGKSKTLNRAELEDVRLNVRRANALNQKAYVAISFDKPQQKVIVIWNGCSISMSS